MGSLLANQAVRRRILTDYGRRFFRDLIIAALLIAGSYLTVILAGAAGGVWALSFKVLP